MRFDSYCATLAEVVKVSLGKLYHFTNLNAHTDTHHIRYAVLIIPSQVCILKMDAL